MENTNGKNTSPSNGTVEEKRRSSVIEHEYMFDTIPQGRPTSEPTPSGKTSSHNSDNVNGDGERNPIRNTLTIASSGGSDTQPGTSQVAAIGGVGDAKMHKQVANVEVSRHELYKEAVYTCAHYLGLPSPQRFPTGQEEMCLYSHEIFSESRKEQDLVLDTVRNEPFPLTIVNAKVKKCSGLRGSKSNGFVDPYCIVTIETEDSSVVFQLGRREWQQFSTESPVVRENRLKTKHLRPPAEDRTSQVYEKVPDYIKTSVQRHQQDPKWDQRFQCLSLRPSVDKLTVEIWDHSIDDKYVAKAIRNLDEPVGTSTNLEDSLRSTHANIERKTGDIFLGKVSVRVSEIPCDGSDAWYNLTGTPQTKDKTPHGRIRLQIWLVHAYRHGRLFTEVAEPKIILGHLWDWVLNWEKKKYSDLNKWDGSIPTAATCLLFQYALQNGISEDTHAIIRWNAYAKHNLGLPGLVGLKDAIEKTKYDEDGKGKLPPRLSESKPDVEDNVLVIVRDKICPIIRNHLREPVERVHEALLSYQHCVDILSKYNNTPLLQKIEWLVLAALRMCILEWYQHVYANSVPSQGQVEKGIYVSSVVQVMKEVNSLLRLGEVKWSPEFWLTASIKYLPIIYDELQKMVIHDVEAICWLFFQFYHDPRKLRKILLFNEERDRVFCSAFFDLYKQTQIFVFAQIDIFSSATEYPFLESYHRWFRPILVLWLGFALIRGSLMICKTINIDNHVHDNSHSMTSSSALDTANVFAQLVQFWSTLSWPDVPEGYVIINFLMEVMCSYTVLYAELKHAKLNKEGYYDPQGKFTVSERLCTALNNIEHVKTQLQHIPKEIDYENLMELLEEVCGKSTHVVECEKRAEERLDKTLKIVDKHINDILKNVGQRIQKEVSTFVKESFKALAEVKSDKINEAMEPIIAYLEDNIVVLQNSLHPHNFHKILQLLWDLVCVGLHDVALTWEMNNTDEQVMFFERVMQTIPYLQSYFQGGAAGLTMEEMNTPQLTDMQNLFSYYTMSTEELILIYYHTRAQFHMNFKGKSKLGSLRVKIGYWNQKLSVEVISASKLTPHDQQLTVLKYFHKMNPTSDSMVDLELKPASYFANEKKYTTQVRWKNLDPVFEESFYWPISQEDCVKKAAAVVFTVKDYDLLTKNAFLGEAIVPLHAIPGISQSPETQPMNLALHEVDPEDHALLILKSRKWDATAKQFGDEELQKFVEPVVPRKSASKL